MPFGRNLTDAVGGILADFFLSVLEASGIEAACSTTTTASGLIRGRMVCQLRRGLDGTRWDP
jgi:hypothetical protein